MLPVVPIAPENYRLAQAFFMVPLVLTVWVLMAEGSPDGGCHLYMADSPYFSADSLIT